MYVILHLTNPFLLVLEAGPPCELPTADAHLDRIRESSKRFSYVVREDGQLAEDDASEVEM